MELKLGTESPEGIKAELNSLFRLVRDYAKQETVDPIKTAGIYVVKGFIGSILIIFGVSLLSLGGLRGLQTQSAFDGNWSFAPYLIVTVVLAVLIILAIRAVGSKNRAEV